MAKTSQPKKPSSHLTRKGGLTPPPPAPLGNTRAEKFPTPEARAELLEELCHHLEKGLSQECFPLCEWDTVQHYMNKYPADLPTEKIRLAKRKGQLFWEETGIEGARGGIKFFNVSSWIFNMKNRYGWKDRVDVTSGEKRIYTGLLPSKFTNGEGRTAKSAVTNSNVGEVDEEDVEDRAGFANDESSKLST